MLIFVPGTMNDSNRSGGFPEEKTKNMKTINFDKLVTLGVKMVLDCTPVSMAVAVLSATNHLTVEQAVQLKNAIIDVLR